jgi:hypothetical protein
MTEGFSWFKMDDDGVFWEHCTHLWEVKNKGKYL